MPDTDIRTTVVRLGTKLWAAILTFLPSTYTSNVTIL